MINVFIFGFNGIEKLKVVLIKDYWVYFFDII